MTWAEITVSANRLAEDAVASILIDEGCRGAATVHPSAPSSEARVSGYLPVDDLLEARLQGIKGRIRGLKAIFEDDIGSLEITLRRIHETDWAEEWKSYYKPFAVGRVVVKPSWETYEPEADQIVIDLDPGMAFGTGQHPTTQLCILAVQEQISGGESVADIGTGSGLLAIAAAKLGARKVYAIDIDSVAVEAAVRNVRHNGLENIVFVWQGDTISSLPEDVDVIIANIVPNVILDMASQASAALKPGGIMIASGIIVEREADVIAKLQSVGLDTLKVERDGSWVAVHSRKGGGED